MVVYYFNKGEFLKLKVIGEPYLNYGNYFRVNIDKSNDPRKDRSKDWISCSPIEGEVRYKMFWLSEEDDEKAKEIYNRWYETTFNRKLRELRNLENFTKEFEPMS